MNTDFDIYCNGDGIRWIISFSDVIELINNMKKLLNKPRIIPKIAPEGGLNILIGKIKDLTVTDKYLNEIVQLQRQICINNDNPDMLIFLNNYLQTEQKN